MILLPFVGFGLFAVLVAGICSFRLGKALNVIVTRTLDSRNANMRFLCPKCGTFLPPERVKHCSTCGMVVVY